MSDLLDDILAAKKALEMPEEPQRLILVGPQSSLDRWKKMFGNSVDYILGGKLS